MKNECSIIRDILPLYAENMVSADTASFVEEHLKNCDACRKEYAGIKEPQTTHIANNTAPLWKLKKKMAMKRAQTIAFTAVLVITLLVSAFAVLDTPRYLPYSDGLITAEPFGDKGMLLTFNETVTGVACSVYSDPNGGDFYYCDIEAWTSLWDQWFSKENGKLSKVVTTKDAYPMIAAYAPNDGSDAICIATYIPKDEGQGICIDGNENYESHIVLPRLSLGYYLILAAAALLAIAVVWFAIRGKTEIRVWVERIGLYPISYIISHCIVSGISTTAYSLQRDFSLIVFISLLLYCSLLLAHSIWRLRKEIAEVNHNG